MESLVKEKPDPACRAWFAVASPGLEDAVAREVERVLPGCAFSQEKGGVLVSARVEQVRRALPLLRVTTRLWQRVAQTRGRAFGELERKWAALPWESYVRAGQSVRIDVTTHRCRLHHTGALRERLLDALGKRLGQACTLVRETDDAESHEPGSEARLAARLLVRGEQDAFELSVDAGGDTLAFRGYRLEIGKAPLRETLAAGLLHLAGWTPAEPLVDPMCGAGTIPIEAALLGVDRTQARFAMDDWPSMTPRAPVMTQAPAAGAGLVLGCDRDPQMVDKARRNAARAGADTLRFEAQTFEALAPPAPSGLLLFNPPYGHRLGGPSAVTRQWRDLAKTLALRWQGWRAGVLVPQGTRLEAPGLRTVRDHPLKNGGLPVSLLELAIGPGAGP